MSTLKEEMAILISTGRSRDLSSYRIAEMVLLQIKLSITQKFVLSPELLNFLDSKEDVKNG